MERPAGAVVDLASAVGAERPAVAAIVAARAGAVDRGDPVAAAVRVGPEARAGATDAVAVMAAAAGRRSRIARGRISSRT